MNKIASKVFGVIHREDGVSHTAFDAAAMDFNDLMIELARQDQIDVVQVDVYYNLTLRKNKFARYQEAMRTNTDVVIFDPNDEMRWGTSAIMELVETKDVLERLFIHLEGIPQHHANVGDVFVIRSRDWGFFCGAFLCEDIGWARLFGNHIDVAMPNITKVIPADY